MLVPLEATAPEVVEAVQPAIQAMAAPAVTVPPVVVVRHVEAALEEE
jgi:hypothetical protein